MKPLAAPARSALPAGSEHEELVVREGERSGLTMAIAIHSTVLGPALGGMRMWHYETRDDAIADVLRLAHGMTLKAAAAGLSLGGGKGVVCVPSHPPTGDLRRAVLHDFGDLVEELDGRYVTAEDVGTTPHDMVEIAARTHHVTGLPPEQGGAGDPSPFTAIGVQAAMRAACDEAFGEACLRGRRIVISGLGHVGENLARGLAEAGAQLVLSDIAEEKTELASELGADWVDPGEAATADCDVFAPCAVGGAINHGNIDDLRCRVVCGAANNQLADEALALDLAARGIVFAPDFIANAGGLINVYRELNGASADAAMELTLGIEGAMRKILVQAGENGITPLQAAWDLAADRLRRHT